MKYQYITPCVEIIPVEFIKPINDTFSEDPEKASELSDGELDANQSFFDSTSLWEED